MLVIIFSITLIIFLVGLMLLILIIKKGEGYGVLKGNKIYYDSHLRPAEILTATSIKLVGKPDYLIREDGMIYPVEIKTGKTPNYPYLNHTMQLMAYCYLVEEYYHIKPKGGYLKYLDREFKIAYTQEARESIKEVVQEILAAKKSGRELHCDHPAHNQL